MVQATIISCLDGWKKIPASLFHFFPLNGLNPTAESLTGVKSRHLFARNSPRALVSHRIKAEGPAKALCGPAACSRSLLISYLSSPWPNQSARLPFLLLLWAFVLTVFSARMFFFHTASSSSLHLFQVPAHVTNNTHASSSLSCSSCFIFIHKNITICHAIYFIIY